MVNKNAEKCLVIQSWDTAIKLGNQHDNSVCLTFEQNINADTHSIVDCWCGRKEYPELKRKVMALAGDYCPDVLLIEDKASGQSLIQDLRRETNLPVIAIMPKGDKVTRFAQVTPMIEAGQVWLPKRAAWLAAFEQELLMFPNGAHDDRVDALSQYLNWVRAGRRETLGIRRI
jgi:predicted phage terminase large subunit-like protein